MRMPVLAVAALALSAACGTTVPLSQQARTGSADLGGSAESGTVGGTAAPASDAAGSGAGSSAAPGAGSSGTRQLPGTTAPTSLPGSTTGGTTSSDRPSLSTAPGVTARTIAIGYTYYTNSAAGDAAIGASYDYGDPNADLKAAVDYANKHGGILGRKIELKLFADDSGTSTTQSFDSDYQVQCEHWTRDVKVFAVLNASYPLYRKCLAARGVLPIGADRADLSEADYKALPSFFSLSGITTEAVARNLVDALARTDYLRRPWDASAGAPAEVGKPKIGILYSDGAEWQNAVKNVLIGELAKRGVTVSGDSLFQYKRNQSASEAGSTITSIQSAVLKFQSSGVTNVIVLEPAGLAFFSQGANGQGYHPRYGLPTTATAQADVDGRLIPANQLTGAVGLGWLPALDVHDAGTKYPPPGRTSCLRAMKAEGISPTGDLEEAVALAACDYVFLAQTAISRAASLTPLGVVDSVEQIGGSYPFASIPGGQFRPGKRYPIDRGWLWAWSSGCTCATYTSGSFALR